VKARSPTVTSLVVGMMTSSDDDDRRWRRFQRSEQGNSVLSHECTGRMSHSLKHLSDQRLIDPPLSVKYLFKRKPTKKIKTSLLHHWKASVHKKINTSNDCQQHASTRISTKHHSVTKVISCCNLQSYHIMHV